MNMADDSLIVYNDFKHFKIVFVKNGSEQSRVIQIKRQIKIYGLTQLMN